MKVERLVVMTKSFKARIRVQNGRIVHAPRVIAWACRKRLTELEDWLLSQYPEHVIATCDLSDREFMFVRQRMIDRRERYDKYVVTQKALRGE